MLNLNPQRTPPEGWLEVRTIDAHAAGEPLRVVISGFPDLPGDTIPARRRYAMEHCDSLRKALMWEPRGHADMYGCILTPPVTQGAAFGVLFLHNEGFSTMCGHGIIAVTKVVLDTGMLPMSRPETMLRIDTPAGLVTAHARIENKTIRSVYFHNVPSFVVALDETVEVPGLGRINYDLAFGGAFYAFVKAADAGVEMIPDHHRTLIEKGMAVKRAVMNARPMEHPFDADLNFLYGTIFTGPPMGANAHSRNVCIFAEGEVDRSPTGTGVSARMAIHHKRGEIAMGEYMVIESILGTTFTGRVQNTTRVGPFDAVIPEVEGQAFITGQHRFWFDPVDPLKQGFILR
ncbi:MAG: proline racemase family protein [Planctomycetota bacterium]|jgi:trans-L-3-hydroxyproline dehydratase